VSPETSSFPIVTIEAVAISRVWRMALCDALAQLRKELQVGTAS
jgi:hypothetical protein